MDEPVDQILTTKDLPGMTNGAIKEATWRWWRHMGRGPRSFKIGGRVCYRRSDVERFLREQYEQTVSA